MKKIILAVSLICISIFASACNPYMMMGGGCFGNPNNGNDYYDDDTYDDSYDDTTYDPWEDETSYDDSFGGDDYSSVAGTYICEDTTNYSEGYFPYVDLYSDGTFLFSVNLGEGMGTITGTYSVDGDYIYLYVESRDFSGFYGDDQDTITFFIVDSSNIELYSDDIGITYSGEFFYYSY